MIRPYSPLRMMILASLPCVGSYCTLAYAELSVVSAPMTKAPNIEALTTTTAIIEPAITPASLNSSIPNTTSTQNSVSASFIPTLVGVFINGQERDSLDVLYQQNADKKNANNNDLYYLSIYDLNRLTTVSLVANSIKANVYQVSTPIGDTTLTAKQVISYQGQDYIAISTLKKLGITADYSQQDLAINLNMGWRLLQQPAATTSSDVDQATLPIDYRPSKAGLLGLSFNSNFSASDNNGQNDISTTNRQIYTDIGAFGYGLGGVWGVKAIGYDSSSSNDDPFDERISSNDRDFVRNTFNGLNYLPSDWENLEIDNLYWAKSGKNFATRLGTNQPNSLGQGAQTSGSEFTGALVAYSNRDIARHLSYFDEDSRSLLQNTSQDYQHLTGIGEAGGVAELRINGRAIARVQIGLDGRYEFLNLDVSQLALTDTLIELAIFAYPLAQQPLEVRPIILGKRRTNVATDELIIEAGFGRTGDLINNRNRYSTRYNTIDDNEHTAAHLYAEYGINNRLAVRGGVNNNLQNPQNDDNDLSWNIGANFTPMIYSNVDLSYAHTPIQELWQAQLQYQRKEILANYQYQARQLDKGYINAITSNTDQTRQLDEQRHQLLLSYRPNDRTSINLNQYYDDLASNDSDLNGYHAYTSINHRFNKALNGSVNWNSRNDRYGYNLLWQDIYRANRNNNYANGKLTEGNLSPLFYLAGIRDTVGLSGDNNSDTLSLRRQFTDRISAGQAFSNLHGSSNWLNQGDISYRFDQNFLNSDGVAGARSTDSLVNIGYSLYDGNVGFSADWQLTHQNGLSFGLGYKHRYIDTIPDNRYNNFLLDDTLVNGNLLDEDSLPAWTQNNYLYARLSFDMFKAPKQRLKFGNYPRQTEGSVVVNIDHAADSPIDTEDMRFKLDNQQVTASLLSSQPTNSQYLIKNIKAGDYNLTMDAKNLPLEYSTSELPTPRIRISNYAPTSVPIQLQKNYGFAGKLKDAKEEIVIDIYQGDTLIESITSGNYGYFQAFGLKPNTYTIKAKGYDTQPVDITNDFVMQLLLQSSVIKN